MHHFYIGNLIKQYAAHFYRATQQYSRGFGSRNSVRPSVRHTRALWQNERTYCRYIDTIWKGWADVLFYLKFAFKMTYPLSKNVDYTLIEVIYQIIIHFDNSDTRISGYITYLQHVVHYESK